MAICDKNKEFVSSFIYFHKLTISQSKTKTNNTTIPRTIKSDGDF
jgi:hypothetical protein